MHISGTISRFLSFSLSDSLSEGAVVRDVKKGLVIFFFLRIPSEWFLGIKTAMANGFVIHVESLTGLQIHRQTDCC